MGPTVMAAQRVARAPWTSRWRSQAHGRERGAECDHLRRTCASPRGKPRLRKAVSESTRSAYHRRAPPQVGRHRSPRVRSRREFASRLASACCRARTGRCRRLRSFGHGAPLPGKVAIHQNGLRYFATTDEAAFLQRLPDDGIELAPLIVGRAYDRDSLPRLVGRRCIRRRWTTRSAGWYQHLPEQANRHQRR